MFIITSNLKRNTFSEEKIIGKNTQYYIKESDNILK